MKALVVLLGALCLHAQSGGTLQGRVTNRVTGGPVAGVKVRLTSGRKISESTSDAAGFYRFQELAAADYTASFTEDDFGYINPIHIHLGVNSTVEKDVQLTPYGSIRGRVLDEEGAPVAGIRVDLAYSLGQYEVRTNAAGEFLFKVLGADILPLVARPEPKFHIEEGERISPVPTYFPSTTDPAQAIPVVVHTGQNLTDLDIRLRNEPVYRVSGVVVGPGGSPAPNVKVRLLNRKLERRDVIDGGALRAGVTSRSHVVGPAAEPEIASVESSGNGSFEFPAVQSGDWTLSALTPGPDESLKMGVTPVFVSASDVDQVRIQLSPPFAVDVVEDWAGVRPTMSFSNPDFVQLIPLEGQFILPQDSSDRMSRITGLFPGRYRVLPYSYADAAYIDSITWNGVEVSGQVIELHAGDGPIRARFKTGAGRVRGTVDGCEGGAIFLENRDSRDVVNVHTVECRADGSFEFVGVAPGDYYIAAFRGSSDAPVPWGSFPAAIAASASAVRIESGSNASIDLKANSWPW